MKVLFFGTPLIAVPFLEWCFQHHTVVGVVCQPDRPVGRGYELTAPPTKVWAQKYNLPVFQPAGPWTEQIHQQLLTSQADLGITIAYGRIMPESILAIPRLGTINIHFSLLPHYRGAAPMQWSLMNGESQTGVTLFWLDAGMDTGPIAHQKAVAISEDDDSVTLKKKLVETGLHSLQEFMTDVQAQHIHREPQAGTPSYAPLLKKEVGQINWTHSAEKIHNLIRGVVEWPGAVTRYVSDGKQKQLKIFKAKIMDRSSVKSPGIMAGCSSGKGLLVQTGQGQLALLEVQPEGKKRMSAWDFWQGAHLKEGDSFL